MGNNVKVLIGELNGQELNDSPEEYSLQFDDLPTVDVSTVTPNVGDRLSWNGTKWVPITTNEDDFLSCVDHILSSESFILPIRRQMVCYGDLEIEGSLTIDGTLILED